MFENKGLTSPTRAEDLSYHSPGPEPGQAGGAELPGGSKCRVGCFSYHQEAIEIVEEENDMVEIVYES